jgi:deoxyadenosine/deoxycytidine kinase
MAVSPKFHIVVTGAIGTGKTTFLKEFQEFCVQKHPRYKINTFEEPIDKWTGYYYGPNEKVNLLKRMYKNPRKYGYDFQVLATSSKAKQLAGMEGICLVERSFADQREVFIPLLREQKKLCRLRQSLLNDVILQFEALHPVDVVIVLNNVTVEEAALRVQRRGRKGEELVTKTKLEQVDQKYRMWIERMHEWVGNPKVLNITARFDTDYKEQIYESIWKKLSGYLREKHPQVVWN